MKILFTGGGGVGSEAIYRLLKDKYELYFADMLPEGISNEIPLDNRLKILPAGDPDFEACILKIDEIYKFEFIVPGVDEELVRFSNIRGKLNAKLFLPEKPFVALMLDKHRCIKDMEERGLDVPGTSKLSEARDLSKEQYPTVIKPNVGRGSRGVAIVGSPDEIKGYLMFNRANPDNIILQELGHGQEYTVFVSANKLGELNAIIPVKVVQKKGVTVVAEACDNTHVIKYVKDFHARYQASGVYNLQCMVAENGRVIPFEINPRVSTTFCLALYAGFDPFYHYELPANELYEIKKPCFLRRFTHNEMFR